MPVKEVGAVLSSGAFWIIAFAFLFHVMALSTLMTHIMPFFSNIGLERSTSSFIISSIPIIGIIGRVGFGWLGDYVDKIKISTLSLALTGVGVLIITYVTLERLWLVGIFIVIFGIGWGGLVPMLPGLVIKYFGKNNTGTFIGAVSSVMMLGMITGAPIAGWIFDMKGSCQMVWFIMGSMLILMTFVFFFLMRRYSIEKMGKYFGGIVNEKELV
ncbi:MFS transporter [Thermodesulfobacteriota bacterium]